MFSVVGCYEGIATSCGACVRVDCQVRLYAVVDSCLTWQQVGGLPRVALGTWLYGSFLMRASWRWFALGCNVLCPPTQGMVERSVYSIRGLA